jgi:hypothetical protein
MDVAEAWVLRWQRPALEELHGEALLLRVLLLPFREGKDVRSKSRAIDSRIEAVLKTENGTRKLFNSRIRI